MAICAHCGKVQDDGAFCRTCGARMTDSRLEPAATQTWSGETWSDDERTRVVGRVLLGVAVVLLPALLGFAQDGAFPNLLGAIWLVGGMAFLALAGLSTAWTFDRRHWQTGLLSSVLNPFGAPPPRSGRAVVIAHSVVRSLLLGIAVMVPGMWLLASDAMMAGMLWLFVGSFGMVAWTFRKPWRLGLVSCLAPPVAAAVCYFIQLSLFAGYGTGQAAPPALLVAGAVALGVAIGWYRGRIHELRAENGSIFAQRSIGYLAIWVAAYAITQLLAFTSREALAVQSGLVTGAFSTAMLAAVSIVILHKKQELLRSLATAATVVAGLLLAGHGLVGTTAAQSNAEQPVYDILKKATGKIHELVITSDMASAIAGKTVRGPTERVPLPEPRLREVSHDKATARYTIKGLPVTVTLQRFYTSAAARPGRFDQGLLRDRGTMTLNGVPVRIGMSAVSAGTTTFETAAATSKDAYRITAELRVSARDAPAGNDPLGLGSAANIMVAGAMGPMLSGALVAQLHNVMDVEPPATFTPPPRAEPEHELPPAIDIDPVPDADRSPTTDRTPSSERATQPSTRQRPWWGDSTPFADDIKVTTAGIAAILVAAGIAVQVAQAIAASMAGVPGAPLAPGQPAQWSSGPTSGRTGAIAALQDPYDGEALPQNADGQYWVARQGGGQWASRAEAERYVGELEREKAQHEAQRARERAAFDRDTQEAIERSKAEGRARVAAQREWIASQEKARRDLAEARRVAAKQDYGDIYKRTGAENIFNEDGSLDTDRVQRVKDAVRGRLGRDTAAPDETLGGTSTASVLTETAVNTADEAADSMVIRMGAGYLTGGLSEIGFQGGQAVQAVKKATEAAVDSGKDFTGTEGFVTAAGHIARENLPVNTVDALGRIRAGEDVSWTELGVGMIADVGAAGDIGIKPGRAASAFVENTLDANSLDALKTATAEKKEWAAGALERVGIKTSDAADLPPNRLSPGDAKDRFIEGRTSDHTNSIIRDVQSSPRPETSQLDDAFEQGRAAGRAKVNNLTKAVDDLDAAKARGASPTELEDLQRRVRDESIRVQGDKHAMNELNKLPRDGDGNNSTIGAFNREWSDIYDEADRNVKDRLAGEMGVRPDDIQTVTVTNVKGGTDLPIDPKAPARDHNGLATATTPDGSIAGSRAAASTPPPDVNTKGTGQWASPPEPRADKASFDRDLTMRARTVENGREVWRDVPASVTGRVYNEEVFKAAKGVSEAPVNRAPGQSIEAHLTPDEHLADPLDINDADKFSKRMDQAATDRMDAEAYGAGQADLDAATKDAFRGRDFIDAKAVAKTTEYKVHHWMNEADDLKTAARQASDPATANQLLQQSSAHLEEGQRQLVKQYDNMVVKRTAAMQEMGNAPNSSIPNSLAERVSVLKGVQHGRLTPAQAEETLVRMGTSTKQVSSQMSAYVEGLQDARPSPGAAGAAPDPGRSVPTLTGWKDDFQREDQE